MDINKSTEENTRSLPVWASIVLIMLAIFIVAGVFQFFGMVILGLPLNDMESLQNIDSSKHLVLQILTTIPIVLMVYLFRKYVDQKSFISLGLSAKKRFPDLMLGIITAVGIIGGGTLILIVLGYAKIEGANINLLSLVISFVLFVFVSINEELLVRGYILNNLLSTKLNKYLALTISALIFALLHGFNFNLSWIGLLNLLIAGYVLGASYVYTQNLWFPISLHLFWNFIQGPVLGYNVSGQGTESVFRMTLTGNNNISGGDFGFEGSLICTLLTAFTTLIIIIFFTNKEN